MTVRINPVSGTRKKRQVSFRTNHCCLYFPVQVATNLVGKTRDRDDRRMVKGLSFFFFISLTVASPVIWCRFTDIIVTPQMFRFSCEHVENMRG